MKHALILLIASASLGLAQTRTATVDGDGTLVHPLPGAFATANDLPLRHFEWVKNGRY